MKKWKETLRCGKRWCSRWIFFPLRPVTRWSDLDLILSVHPRAGRAGKYLRLYVTSFYSYIYSQPLSSSNSKKTFKATEDSEKIQQRLKSDLLESGDVSIHPSILSSASCFKMSHVESSRSQVNSRGVCSIFCSQDTGTVLLKFLANIYGVPVQFTRCVSIHQCISSSPASVLHIILLVL